MSRNVCVLVFLAVFQPALSELSLDDMFYHPSERCLKEAGIKRDDVMEFGKKRNISGIFEENRSCYILCVGKELGKFRDDGTFNLKPLMEYAAKNPDESTMLPIFIKCAEKRGANPCETLQKNLECLWTAERKYGKIPSGNSKDDIDSSVPNNVTNA